MIHKRCLHITKLLLFAFVATTLPVIAQVNAVAISGTVTDPSGARVEGAKIGLVSAGTGLHRDAVTDENGIYRFPALPPGDYQVSVSKEGFSPIQIPSIELSVGQPRTVDVQLKVGEISSTVVVNETSDYLNRSSAEVGGLVDKEQIKEIPISGRNWASLMLLAPGAVNYSDGSQRNIRFNGHSIDDANYTFDGIDNNGVQEQTQKAETRLNVALDSIAEFRVSTSTYTAESGAAGGVQVNVVSKTGSNDFHGGTFYALRNDALDARGPFDDPVKGIPPFTLHQFGANFGGPLKKNKVFFYANYEGLLQDLGVTFNSYVPNAAYRAQVLAKSPALKPVLDAYPTGGTPVDSITNVISLVSSNTVQENSGMFRLDYHFSDKTTAYARYNTDDAYIDNPTDALGSHNVVPHRPTNIVFQLQHTFAPTTVNEAEFGINRANYHNWSYGIFPISVSPGGSFTGLSSNSLDTEVGTTFSYIDNLTVIRGRHNFKFGINIMRVRLNNSGNTLTTQSIGYSSTDDFINNKASSASYLQGEGVVGNRRTFYMGYAQDEFKATKNLTLNFGLRYEYYSVVHEILNRSQVVDIVGCGGFCPKGTPYYDPNTKDFGPRVGLAWAPAIFGGKTTIRTGFGIYFGGNQNDDFSDPAESAVPRFGWTNSDIPTLSYPLTPFLDPKYESWSPKALDRHRKDLYYENWSFMVQQQLPKQFVFQVGYVGGEGHHLFSKYTINLIDPATGKRPLTGFSSFGFKTNDGNNNFNALQAMLERRFVSGFLLQMNYSWSHGITDASIGSGEGVSVQNNNCRACDRSNSNIDVRHAMTMNAVYQLPLGPGKHFLNGNGFASQVLGGWSLAGIISARSGLPMNITLSRSTSQLPDGYTSGQRPDLVPGVSIYPANQSITNWLNPAAFAIPAKGTWGNLGRYIANGPSNYEIDSSLTKTFKLSERMGFNFRAAAFNLLNHPMWKNPASSLGSFSGGVPSATFGKVTAPGILNTGATGTGAARRIEFMMRLEF